MKNNKERPSLFPSPFMSDLMRKNTGFENMCSDLDHICNSLGIYNDFTRKPESDPHVRQFLEITLFFNTGEEVNTTVYKDIELKKLVFRLNEHAQKAREATHYKVNKVILESPARAAYRGANWEILSFLEE